MPSPGSIQVVSRYVPIAGRAGHFTYLLDLLRHLHRSGFRVELDVLDRWYLEENIPQKVREIADVRIQPSEMPDAETQAQDTRGIKSWLRPLYAHLPAPLLAPLRKAFYGIRGKEIQGHHAHDAPATQEEIAWIAQRCRAFRPDVILLNHTCLGNAFQPANLDSAALKAIVTHHVESQRYQDFQHLDLLSRDSVWDAQKEAELFQDADVLLAIQEEDAVLLRRMSPNNEVICAPMSAACHEHAPSEQVAGRCLFIGSDIDHNVHGLRWFLREVWPLVQRALPACELNVCGSVGTQIPETHPQVKLLGRVEDIGRQYAEAELCIIPLIAGSGLKIKLVEALSHGRACVATSVGVQGVRELVDKAVLLADAPHEFADAICRILQDSELRQSMQQQARHFAIAHFAPEATYAPFITRIHRHIHDTRTQHEQIAD